MVAGSTDKLHGCNLAWVHDRIVEDDLALPLTRPSLSRQVCQTLGRAGLAAYELMLTRAVGQLLSRLRAAVRECPG